MRFGGWVLIAMSLAACGGQEPTPGLDTVFPDAHDPAYAASLDAEVDPRVSRSAGTEGGVVILWPRVIPASHDFSDEAALVQERLGQIARRERRTELVDVRPEPERVCPRSGCAAASVGAVLLHTETGCTVVVGVSLPGTSPARLVPWIGDVDLQATMVPFRGRPEEHIDVSDFVRCADLSAALAAEDGAIVEAIDEVALRTAPTGATADPDLDEESPR